AADAARAARPPDAPRRGPAIHLPRPGHTGRRPAVGDPRSARQPVPWRRDRLRHAVAGRARPHARRDRGSQAAHQDQGGEMIAWALTYALHSTALMLLA